MGICCLCISLGFGSGVFFVVCLIDLMLGGGVCWFGFVTCFGLIVVLITHVMFGIVVLSLSGGLCVCSYVVVG